MAERAEDFDYEPDVLKFKQIWDEMSETTKQKKEKEITEQPRKPKSRDNTRNIN